MPNYAQNRVIAVLFGLAVWIALEDRGSLQHPVHEAAEATSNDRMAYYTLLVTFFGVAFTAALVWVTRQSARAALKAAEHIERAYFSGGGPVIDVIGGSRHFYLSINNYGKTAGEMFEYGLGFCEEGDLLIRPIPKYERKYFRDWLKSGAQILLAEPFAVPPHLSAKWVVYGRIYYRDIFGAKHSAGFVQRGMYPIPAPDAYTSLRDDWE